jgi:hypothetical protein
MAMGQSSVGTIASTSVGIVWFLSKHHGATGVAASVGQAHALDPARKSPPDPPENMNFQFSLNYCFGASRVLGFWYGDRRSAGASAHPLGGPVPEAAAKT